MAHTEMQVDGLRVLRVAKMPPQFRAQPMPGVAFEQHREGKAWIEREPLKEPVDIVHAKDIAEYFAIDIQDVWPLVHQNVIGRRVPYNSGETEQHDYSEPRWEPQPDDHGNTHMERVVHYPVGTFEVDDGMYVRLSDLTRYARNNGWKKGAGLPEKTAMRSASTGLDELRELVVGLAKSVDGLTKVVARR